MTFPISTAGPDSVRFANSRPAAGWSAPARRVASALLLLHLGALVAAPCAVEPTSMLFRNVWTVYRPYLDAAYLNHGYHFFAPEPGPSHLIRYVVDMPDGSRQTGVFPDKTRHRPRLLYHRHFMLSEHLNGMIESDAAKPVVEAQISSFARHLLGETGGERVSLFLMRHLIAAPNDVLDGVRLDDPRSYQERPLGTFTAEGA